MLTRLTLFPDTTHIIHDTLTIGGLSLTSLAEEFGTPLYIYDRATMDASVEAYRAALKAHYPAEAQITYAGKAFLCTAIAEWIEQMGLWADCTGAGEIAVAAAGRVPRERIVVHGVNKSDEDLAAARRRGGTIVVDNLSELERLKNLKVEATPGSGRPCRNTEHLAEAAARAGGCDASQSHADRTARKQVRDDQRGSYRGGVDVQERGTAA